MEEKRNAYSDEEGYYNNRYDDYMYPKCEDSYFNKKLFKKPYKPITDHDNFNTMKKTAKSIIANRRSIKVYGNKFDFKEIEYFTNSNLIKAYYGGFLYINGEKLKYNSIVPPMKKNDTIVIQGVEGILKVSPFHGIEIHNPSTVYLNTDFSVEKISLDDESKVIDTETKQESYLFPAKNQVVSINNFYTFDKENKNIITGVKQQITYFIEYYCKEDLNSMLENAKKSKINKKEELKISLFEKILDCFFSEKKKENKEEEKKNKNNTINNFEEDEEERKNLAITFANDYACVVSTADLRRLLFFKKDKKQNEYNFDGDLYLNYKCNDLTAFNDDFIITAGFFENHNYDNKIVVVYPKDKRVKMTIKMPPRKGNEHKYRCLLSRMNFDTNRGTHYEPYKPYCNFNQFKKIIKVFFDKNAIESNADQFQKKAKALLNKNSIKHKNKDKKMKKEETKKNNFFISNQENKEEEKKNKNNTINNFDEEEEEEINTSKKEVKIKKKEDKKEDEKKEDEEEPLNKINYRTKEEVEIIERKRKEKEKREKEEKKKEYNERSKNKILFFSFNDDKQKKKEEKKEDNKKEVKKEVKQSLKGAGNEKEKGNG